MAKTFRGKQSFERTRLQAYFHKNTFIISERKKTLVTCFFYAIDRWW